MPPDRPVEEVDQIRGWRRRALTGTSGGNLEDLRRLVRADGVWYVKGDMQPPGAGSVIMPWTWLEDLIRQCAATQVPDLTDSAVLVPDPGVGAVVVLVRQRGKPFRTRDLSRAIAWLCDHRPDGAPEPLVAGIAPGLETARGKQR